MKSHKVNQEKLKQPLFFILTKPVARVKHDMDTISKAPVQTKIKLLVVEDEPINQQIATILLQEKGYEVDIAENGKQAIERFSHNQYAVILMDYGLPDMSGLEVTKIIRTMEQNTDQHTPIIALTAHGTVVKNECLAAGMDDFTTKPIELDSFNLLIKRWIEKLK